MSRYSSAIVSAMIASLQAKSLRFIHGHQAQTLSDLRHAISKSDLSTHPTLLTMISDMIRSNCAIAGIDEPDAGKYGPSEIDRISQRVLWQEGHIIRAAISVARKDIKRGL